MFEDAGVKIQLAAKVLCWIGLIISIAASITMFSLAGEYYRSEELYTTLGLIFLLIGPVCSWVNSLLLHGFGELVEDMSVTRGMLAYFDIKQKLDISKK